MKKTTWSRTLVLASLSLALQLSAQINSEQRVLDSENTQIPMPFNCGTVFWTTNSMGQIRQWSLNNGVVSGGTQILTAGEINGIAYGGDGSSTVFYCAIDGGMRSYNSNGWNNTMFANSNLSNNGSYATDHYFMSFTTASIVYYDGSAVTNIPLAVNETHAVADISVDSAGNGWVFTKIGDEIFLKQYNKSDLVSTHLIDMNPTGVYGSFFINDQLYIATLNDPTLVSPNSIIPIAISEGTATLGTPIPFTCNAYTDLASCNITTLSLSNFADRSLKVYPNPTRGILNLSSPNAIDRTEIYSIEGRVIRLVNSSDAVDMTDLPSGSYVLKIYSAGSSESRLVIKS